MKAPAAAPNGTLEGIEKHRDEYASQEDLTVSMPRSVVSGRTMAEIGGAAGASPRQLQQAALADPAASPPVSRPRRKAGPTPRRLATPSRPRRAAGASSRS